jgi:hypothetical protein
MGVLVEIVDIVHLRWVGAADDCGGVIIRLLSILIVPTGVSDSVPIRD